MRALPGAFLVAVLLAQASAVRAEPAPVDVVPLPAVVAPGDGALAVDASFSVALEGAKDERLERAARRLLTDLSRATGLPLAARPSSSARAALIVRVDRVGKPVQDVDEDESYALEIGSSGARLSAPTALGALHGMETFLQLATVSSRGFVVPALAIKDAPRFAWRGLLIDVGRHFMPVDALEREIDALAAVKMNVLHWHLSEYQGFRVESKRFPLLHERGSDGLYYTQDQIRGLVAYARDRGVRIVPEFDMPGHSIAWFPGYPDLASGPGPYSIERRFGIFDPVMDPTRESTYRFLDEFIGEMAGLFPDRYFHIGGDEVNGKQWDANPRIQEFMRAHRLKDDRALQLYFNSRVHELLAKHGKVMDGWEEILGPGLPKDSVVQAWRSQDTLADAVKQGYPGLLSYGYYLDAMWPASQHYLVEPLTGAAEALSSEEKSRVLGGEACLWTEGVSAETMDSRLWPRAAAVAERLWSPRETRDAASLYARLDALSRRLELSGLTQRSGPAAMLRRMTGGADVPALAVLADAVVPVDEETREEDATAAGRERTSATPLNRLSDAVAPESEPARRFALLVDSFLASRDARLEARLRARLAEWRDNDAALRPALAGSFLLSEAAGPSRALAEVGAEGLAALDALDAGAAVPESWKARRSAALDRAARRQADVRLAVVEPVRRLVESARTR